MTRIKQIKTWLGYKFRVIVVSSQSFDEKRKWRFNRLGFVSVLSLICLFIIAIVWAVIAYTPLREFIPGYPNKITKIAIVENAIRLDSLEHEIQIRDQYLMNLKQVLLGEVPYNPELESINQTSDTIFTNVMLNELQHNKLIDAPTNFEKIRVEGSRFPKSFFPPANGVVTNSFDPVRGHYGTDIVTARDEVVRSALPGTVTLANWTIETGYTVQIQHDDNYITIYRHLKKLLVSTGSQVMAGQAIGIYGNTGEISFGPHLHFEIWHKGKALDAEQLIDF
jgi:murein DD-endopeptidase MepM/ murein hydrolase activator NlpD